MFKKGGEDFPLAKRKKGGIQNLGELQQAPPITGHLGAETKEGGGTKQDLSVAPGKKANHPTGRKDEHFLKGGRFVSGRGGGYKKEKCSEKVFCQRPGSLWVRAQ